MMHGSASGINLATSIKPGGSPSLGPSSNPLKHSEAKINAAARAVYAALMNNLNDFDRATEKLKHKSRLIAIAVLDAANRFENHHP